VDKSCRWLVDSWNPSCLSSQHSGIDEVSDTSGCGQSYNSGGNCKDAAWNIVPFSDPLTKAASL